MNATPDALHQSDLKSLPLLHKGKVRDVYIIDAERLLIVATDRLSAFDVVLPDPIPGKGQVLTAVSNFWFQRLQHIVPNHRLDTPLEDVIPDPQERERVRGRAVVAKRARPLPVEAIARGYLIGTGWKDYLATGMVCGIPLPPGLRLAERLPNTLFTPSTKAAAGDHDENVSFAEVERLIGAELAAQVRDITLQLYSEAADYARQRGIIIADTKFEFGLAADGELMLIDEALTPDSSRFWPADAYQIGSSPPSFDKQFVRDYLETLDWDKTAPGPRLPEALIRKTAEKYREAQRRLTNT